MSAAASRFTAIERPAVMQQALNNIGSWMLSTVKVEPGWSELVLDIKPLSGTVFVRITEVREDQDYPGSVGPIKQDSPVLEEIHNLQAACYVEGQGSWLTASVVVTAQGWPEPSYQIGASYDRANEPQDWQGEGRMSARDLREHLENFPREDQYLPAWAANRLAGRMVSENQLGAHDLAAASPTPSNPYLQQALDSFAQDKTEQALANVVRSCLGGKLVMDISQSAQNEQGQEVINYQVLRLSNGMRALTAYSSAAYAQAASQQLLGQGQGRLQIDEAMKVLLQVVQDPSLDVLVLNPTSDQECFIEKAQLQWVLGSPHNAAAARALVEGNMQNLLLSLTAPSSMLLLGISPQDGQGRPLVLKGEEGQNTALVFTSAAEIAALDPTLEVRSAPALEVLRLLAAGESQAVRINALAPHATLPIEQVRELLAVVESQ